ncbi:extracellular ligand-binding receptor [Alcanivorax sp. S71-1-4]|uniref:ABC transporter substrate-binding protein n=1 Tax=Alcanivorax sp. S71-1-4 TaxID=1177159 RepID=UPI00135AE094|nr:ABC transporter substrate-binding protein [Alcanivorax sp. S71-1-4]KAF0808725.1 extracellular ligand-binding receptor [Alcanivorax sp. S71-1-4]
MNTSVTGLLTLLLLAASTLSTAATPIRIGLNYPSSGEYRQEGLMQRRGALMAIDEINAAGGVLGRPIEMLDADTASQPDRAVANVDQLADQGVRMLFGGSSSAVAIAAGRRARERGLLYFGTLTYSNDTTGKDGHRYLFRECYNGHMAARVLSNYLEQNFAGKKYFYVTADYTWGTTTEASMRQFTDTTDVTAHPQVMVPFPRFHYRELKEAMDAAAASDADVLVLVLFGDQMVKAMRLAYELGLTERMQITVPNLTLSMVDQVGPAIMEGVVGASPWTWNVPFHFGHTGGQQFVRQFVEHYNTYPSTSAASAYSIVHQWADAAERARSFDSEALIRALEGHRYTLLKDEQQWRTFDHQNVQSVYAVRIKPRGEVLNDPMKQDYFQILESMSGEDAAQSHAEWLAERRAQGKPETLQ